MSGRLLAVVLHWRQKPPAPQFHVGADSRKCVPPNPRAVACPRRRAARCIALRHLGAVAGYLGRSVALFEAFVRCLRHLPIRKMHSGSTRSQHHPYNNLQLQPGTVVRADHRQQSPIWGVTLRLVSVYVLVPNTYSLGRFCALKWRVHFTQPICSERELYRIFGLFVSRQEPPE